MQFKCKTSLHDLRGRGDIAKYMVYIIFLCTIGLFAIWLGDTFFSLTNILNITRQTAMISVMAVAMVFVIATGGIDLTVSGVVPISGLLCAIVLEKTDNMFAGIAVALLVGTLIGAINGTFITYMKIPAFLMTLGMQFALKGVAMWISDTKSVPIYHKTFNHIFGYSDVFGIPVLLIWTIVFVIIGVILLLFVNRKSHVNPYILVLQCADSATEATAKAYLETKTQRCVLKSKAVQAGNIELNLELRLKSDNTDFINELSAMDGVTSAALVSYNGDYMG